MAGIKEDILGAGLHLLSGAGGDLKLLVGQAVKTIVGDAYVSRAEYESLGRRLAELEKQLGKKPIKSSVRTTKKPTKSKAKRARK